MYAFKQSKKGKKFKMKNNIRKFNLRSNKGAISIFVVVTVLTFLILLMGGFFVTLILQKSQLEDDIRVKEIYAKDVNNIEQIYTKVLLGRGDTTPEINVKLYQINEQPIESTGKYNEIAVTIKISNKSEIGNIDEIVLKKSNGEYLIPNSVIIGDKTADATYIVKENGKYTVSVRATTYGEQRLSTMQVNVNNIN